MWDRYKADIQEAEYRLPYHWFMPRWSTYAVRNSEVIRFVRQHVRGGPVVDLGCGDGVVCGKLLEKAGIGDVVGIDVSVRALRLASVLTDRYCYAAMSICELALTTGSATAMTCLDVLEHLPPSDFRRALSEARRVLSPGGWLMASVPSDRVPVSDKHYQHFSPTALADALEEAGFAVESILGIERDYPLIRWLARRHPALNILLRFRIRVCKAELGRTLLVTARKPH